MILVVGAGAVGTILSAYLMAAKREPLKLYVRDKDAALQTAQDIRVEHVGSAYPPIVAPKPVLTRSLALDDIDYLLICVKFPQLDALLTQIGEVPARCTLVSTLNGVGALRHIRERFPSARVVPLTVMFNGQLLEPLHAQITTRPQILIGSDDRRLLSAFGDSGMKVAQVSGESAAWGKLLINLANAICALTHTTFKDLLTQPDLRAIYVAVLDEAVALLEHARIDYHLPMPIPYGVYRALLAGRTPLPWWFAKLRNGLQAGSYPSMVADVEAGRRTEIGQLNGEIVCMGLEHRRPTPVNAKIVSLVQKIEGIARPPYLTPAELRARLGV
ncbi:2-dehydropantoate 2-reductase N-terminal domain-containing protein [Fontimonas sp. SYSU GA230001]|uniref:ketopantoate reductase family protein n=1 Tax=Fontimonas sp. SYSU GA230001 TaxID=3142450 RepID=UPI0032B387CA